MRQVGRWGDGQKVRRVTGVALGLVVLFVGLGPARAEPVVPTWNDLYPRFPSDLAARAEGIAVTDGRYAPGQLRVGAYATTSGDPQGCDMNVDRVRMPSMELTDVVVGRDLTPKPRGPKIVMIHGDSSRTLLTIRAYVFSGDCKWRWVGTPEDASQWFRP